MANPVIVDDRDTRIKYSPEALWSTGGVSNELFGTTHCTTTTGATATFTFNGVEAVNFWLTGC
jgi:hypothetical protein